MGFRVQALGLGFLVQALRFTGLGIRVEVCRDEHTHMDADTLN